MIGAGSAVRVTTYPIALVSVGAADVTYAKHLSVSGACIGSFTSVDATKA